MIAFILIFIGILFSVFLVAYLNAKLFCLFFTLISGILTLIALAYLLFDRRYPVGKESVKKAPKRNGKIYASEWGDGADAAKYLFGPAACTLIAFIFGYLRA